MKVADPRARSLATSATLSRYYMPEAILPIQVVSVLQRAKIPFVLVGAHAAFVWMGVNEARPTKDVDVIVAARYHQKTVQVLVEAFRDLEPLELQVVTRLRSRKTGDVLIDVMKPTELYRAAFKHTHTVRTGKLTYRVPSLEMALAMKFAPMVSPNRDDVKKLMDSHDFIVMVRANPDIDADKLKELGDLVYPEGGMELLDLVRRVRAGETLIL